MFAVEGDGQSGDAAAANPAFYRERAPVEVFILTLQEQVLVLEKTAPLGIGQFHDSLPFVRPALAPLVRQSNTYQARKGPHDR